jgi:hypothetical protein
MGKVSTHLHHHQFSRSLAAAIVVVAMLLAALSLWTAIPLSWIYIASMLSHTQFPAGGPYMVLFAGIIVSVTLVGWLLARLGALHMKITGTDGAPARSAWLKSVRDGYSARAYSSPLVETVLVASVVLAILILVVWFFFGSAGAEPNAPLG